MPDGSRPASKRPRSSPRPISLLYFWCGQEDLNLHSVSRTSTSSWRVCQFRHGRNGYKTGYIGVPICLQLNDFKEHDLSTLLAPQGSASANSATTVFTANLLLRRCWLLCRLLTRWGRNLNRDRLAGCRATSRIDCHSRLTGDSGLRLRHFFLTL